MKSEFLVLLGLGVLALTILAFTFADQTTASAPMLAMPVKITRGSQPIPPEEVTSVQYAFSEKTTAEAQQVPPSPLKQAKALTDGFYLMDAPITVEKKGLFARSTTSPLYHSLTLRIALKHSETTTLIYPAMSDQRLNQAIFVDLPAAPQR